MYENIVKEHSSFRKHLSSIFQKHFERYCKKKTLELTSPSKQRHAKSVSTQEAYMCCKVHINTSSIPLQKIQLYKIKILYNLYMYN